MESHALNYHAANDQELEDIYTAKSIFSGEKVLRWNSMMQAPEDLIMNMRMKRQNYRRTGTCTGADCVGWNAMNVMWAVTSEIDQEHGTDYQARLKKRKSLNRKRSRKTIIHFKIKLVRETGAK